MEPASAKEREPPPPSAAAEGYDPVELRRRMAVCFSGPELRELAESLGVTGQITWDRGPSESSRDLIKQFEKYYGLGILVAKLRELRPLVEWPEPADPALAFGAPPPPSVVGPPLVAPTLDQREARDGGAPIQDPLSAPPSAAPRSAVARAWPGTTAPTSATPDAPKGIDPRVLIVVAGLTVLAALIAYAAGRASAPPTAAADAAGSALPVGSASPQRPPGPAMRASNAFRRSLDRVVRSCDLPTGSDRDASILGLALGHCGLVLRAPASALTAPPLDPIIPSDRPSTTTRVKPTKTSKDPAQAAIPVTSKGDSCIAGCETDRKSCNDHCGAEPTESSLYDGYMRCRSRCLSATSHCRLACPQ
jgi:hypothetical protein